MTRTPTPLYRVFSSTLSAIENCHKTWLDRHEDTLKTLSTFLPYGSGIDNRVELDRDDSTPEKLVFRLSFHHVNENGFYDGWTDHKLIVKPSLQFGIDIRITGKDRNQIKDYLYETFASYLTANVWINDEDEWQSDN